MGTGTREAGMKLRLHWPDETVLLSYQLTLMRVLVLFGLMSSGLWGLWRWVDGQEQQRRCIQGLQRLYKALEFYEFERGRLPIALPCSDSAYRDEQSLLHKLSPFFADRHDLLCPATPATLRKADMTYVWNTELNGKQLKDFNPPAWVMTEAQALAPALPKPHGRFYHVLYTDGTIRQVRDAPFALAR